MSKAKRMPTPWPKPTYKNDTGPNDDGFWQWWEIEGVGKFDTENDAVLAWRAVNNFDAMLAALKAVVGDLDNLCGHDLSSSIMDQVKKAIADAEGVTE